MSADTNGHVPEHHRDKYSAKYANKIEQLQEKAHTHGANKDDGPAGGFDDTPIPKAPPGYTIRITFHRAENLPFSDFPTFSTDPYIHATFKTLLAKRHKQDPDLFLRTPTIHRNTNPKWETQWVIAHVPASGFFLKCRLYDEDPADHDDRLGNVHVNVDNIWEGWGGIKEQAFDLKKRMGSKRAYTFRGIASLLNRSIKMSGRVFISVENLGRSPGENGGRCYTVAPLTWSRHHSPLIGRITGTKDRRVGKDGKKTERYNFQAIQMQLRGPVPQPMYHRYVEFKPFISGMFTDVTLQGRILNRALHHQHSRIYNYDGSTMYGIFEQPCIEMTKQFLEFIHYDQGGRIYTYVLSLDGLFRFTETGKEFGIDMLSKHTMHSDVSIYIAFSGEFFVRRLRHPHTHHRRHYSRGVSDASNASAASAPADRFADLAPPSSEDADDNDQHHHDNITKDPAYYELIIDNDSGTYRPNAKLLPLLKQYFEANLPGIRVATLDSQSDAEVMKKLKTEQREHKKHTGRQITYLQNSSQSSFSSSDEEELEVRAGDKEPVTGYKKKMAKLQKYGKKYSDPASKSKGRKSQELDTQDAATGHSRHPPSHDSRDYTTSDNSDYRREVSNSTHSHAADPEDDGGQAVRTGSGYENQELPHLLKRDQGGHIPRPQEHNDDTHRGEAPKYGEPETGEHKPAGGIVYGTVVSSAGVESGSVGAR